MRVVANYSTSLFDYINSDKNLKEVLSQGADESLLSEGAKKTLREKGISLNGSTTKDEGMQFPQTVPDNCVFVLGDNRNVSEDSRNPKVGMVDKHFILGKVTMVIYPLHHIKFF